MSYSYPDPISTHYNKIPIGLICLWYGSVATIPAGWALCNGSNNTPDLRNMFVVGAQEDVSGVAKTNLTGSLTVSGGSVSHTHTDHDVTQPAISNHSITQPAITNHSITQPVVANHAITQPAISNHSITQPVINNHTVTTSNCRTSGSAAAAAVTAVSAHSLSTNVALDAHSLSTNVAVDAHTLSTNVAVSAHTLSTDVALSNHSLSTSVALSAHSTTSAPQPYYALCYIMRII
jgi:hypothetical protein